MTVLREPSDIDTAQLPAPAGRVRRPDRGPGPRRPPAARAPSWRARLRDQPSSGSALGRLSGSDPQADLRSALRRAKQLIEVGEVLAVDPAPHGKRTATPGGALLEAWTKVAPKAGVR